MRDPFALFPLKSGAASIEHSIAETENKAYPKMGWYGVPRGLYSVEEELHLEAITALLGAAFVLSQTTITKVGAVAHRIHRLMDEPAWLPAGKAQVMRIGSEVQTATQKTVIESVDAVANYFKHREEWPDEWNAPEGTAQQRRTVAIIRDLGLSQANSENLHVAMAALGIHRPDTVGQLIDKVELWRQNVADHLMSALVTSSVLTPDESDVM
jgi:hypothetical protein